VSGPRVLLAEDDPHLRGMFQEVLVYRGLQVVAVENGEEALREARRERPDVVVLDVMMPVRDGIDTADVPIVALTAMAGQDVQRRALEAGCDLVLTKPITPSHLVQGILHLLEEYRLRGGRTGEAERFASRSRRAAADLVSRGAEVVLAADEEVPEDDAALRSRLQGMRAVPVCSFCGRMRTPGEEWRLLPPEVRSYFDEWTSASHGGCPQCLAREYPHLAGDDPGGG